MSITASYGCGVVATLASPISVCVGNAKVARPLRKSWPKHRAPAVGLRDHGCTLLVPGHSLRLNGIVEFE